MIEFVVVVVLLRRIVTSNGKHKAPPLVGLLARVWITFIILGLSVASLNRLTGMPPEWFKPVWCTLSTFGFAMLAWISSLWFLVTAVQMSLTGMLIARWTPDSYLFYGISWWLGAPPRRLRHRAAPAAGRSRGEIPAAGAVVSRSLPSMPSSKRGEGSPSLPLWSPLGLRRRATT